MNGLKNARRLVAAFLEQNMPGTLEGHSVDRDNWPCLYAASQRPVRLETGEWPAVVVTGQTMARQRATDYESAGDRYLRTYLLRVFVFARANSYDEADDIRNDLTLAVIETLMRQPSLGQTGASFDPSSVRESYSDIDVPPKQRRAIAAAYAEFEVTIEEMLTFDPLAEIEAAEVDPITLPFAVTTVER